MNRAEAEVWKRSAGVRVGYSDEILGFDCGGQQWVMEVRMYGVCHACPLPVVARVACVCS